VTGAPAADCREVAGEGAGQPLIAQLFAALADGRFHSGEELARALGVSRSAVWKAATALRELGAMIHAVRNRGYRLAHGCEALDSTIIRAHLGRDIRDHVTHIETAWSMPSTNTWLLERPNPAPGTAEICLAEYQSAGRGRRGRTWLAPPGGALCFSVSWTFREVPPDFGALSLVMGVCALRVLKSLEVEDVALKWPNDLLAGDRKLGGVLIELRAESTGPACVVVGIGVNVALGPNMLKEIAETGTAATDLVSAGLVQPERNALAAALTSACMRGLRQYEREGLKPFIEEWRAADALRGRAVRMSAMDTTARGVARGIDLHGALLIETPDGVKRFISGDVTVRAD
jgi:BirA family transcriptional regulator, biotin operon repressor / biotin---[acetyl-CoA-carboxylase] ligase